MRDRKDKHHTEHTYRYQGNEIHYRTSTSDMILIYEILLKSGHLGEYWLPQSFQPKSILDIGANIGITSILFSNQYPDCTIHAFEPLPENYTLLEKNGDPYHNITCHPFGLGSQDGSVSLFVSSDPENYGGGSMFNELEVDQSNSVDIKIKEAKSYLSSLLTAAPDLIKIDTEGAEYEILNSFDQDLLSQTGWITGELHGNKDFLLLHQLSELGFNIKINKEVDNRLSMFHAISDRVLKTLSPSEIKQLNKR